MKKLLLLNPPLGEKERSGALATATGRSIPYGLISLASVVRKEGYHVYFLDSANFGYGVEETVNKILAINPDYVGITTVTLSIDRSSKVADLLKMKNSEINIIVGGAHLSSVPEETMNRFSSFDVGVIGEGEETIIEVLKTLDTDGSLKTINGIIYREGHEICKTGQRSMIKDLDSLPLPAWDMIPDMVNTYRPSAPSYLRLPSTTIVTSRGCFGRCIFCNSKMIHGGLRCFSAEYVLKMIRYLVKNYKIKDLSIYDDNFVFFRERVEKICKTILDEKIDITWSCYSRVDQGNLELFKIMKRAGCWQISYGIESGSQRILDLVKKDVKLEQIEKTVTETKKAGLRTRGFFIIGHFTESRESILETINFMKKIPLDDFHFTAFTPLPGTVAYKMADKYGKFDRTWSKMNLQYPAFVPNGLTAEQLEYYSKLAYRSFYFRSKIIVSYLCILFKYPKNVKRLINALQALLLRIFSKTHNDFLCQDERPFAPRGIGIDDSDDYADIVTKWDNVHRYSPAPRHRRRIMMKMLEDLEFRDCLDIGCAQPFFIGEISKRKKDIRIAGCDISENVILSNKKRFPEIDFFVADISKLQTYGKRYDLVTCSEVLEHVEDWQTALKNISFLCRRWLIITVPSGRVYPIDKRIGHIRHFQGDELLSELVKFGFSPVKVCKWGFPFHSMYKYAINGILSDKLYKVFAEENYGIGKRFISNVLYGLFFCNNLFNDGSQFVALMEKKDNH